MAALILFLCFSFFMFQAGYQWRKWQVETPAQERLAARISMIGKL